VLKAISVLFVAFIAGWVLVGSSNDASAHAKYIYRTVHKYRTVHEVTNIVRVHNTWRTKHVVKVRRVVHVTRIQPIVHIHAVKRINYRTVASVRHVNLHVTQVLPAHVTVTHSVVRVWHHNHHHHHAW